MSRLKLAFWRLSWKACVHFVGPGKLLDAVEHRYLMAMVKTKAGAFND